MPGERGRTTLLAALIVLATLCAALRWTAIHSLPLWWDEAQYANQAIEDHGAFERGGVAGVVKALLFNDPERPPAYRAFVVPLTAFAFPRLAVLRAISLTVTLLAMFVLYLACRSALAVAMVFSMPAVFTSAAWFGTEFPLFLAVAMLCAALVPRVSPLLLALAVALGLLSKSTFFIIGAPAILAAMIFARRDRRELVRLVLASAAGGIVAAGWWMWHFGPALRYAQLGRSFVRESLGGSFALVARAQIFAFDGVGILLPVALVIVFALGRWRGEHRRAAIIGLAGALPLLLLACTSPVFVPRHFAPAFLPLALAIAASLDALRPSLRVAAGVIALVQIVAIAAVPERFLERVEQTDWRILRPLVAQKTPDIAFAGAWPSLSPPEVRYAWMREGGDARVRWLWRFEEGPIDWTRVMCDVAASDLVLVVPPGVQPRGDERLAVARGVDNQHDAELIARIESSRAFNGPLRVRAGRVEPVELLVYVKRPVPGDRAQTSRHDRTERAADVTQIGEVRDDEALAGEMPCSMGEACAFREKPSVFASRSPWRRMAAAPRRWDLRRGWKRAQAQLAMSSSTL